MDHWGQREGSEAGKGTGSFRGPPPGAIVRGRQACLWPWPQGRVSPGLCGVISQGKGMATGQTRGCKLVASTYVDFGSHSVWGMDPKLVVNI